LLASLRRFSTTPSAMTGRTPSTDCWSSWPACRCSSGSGDGAISGESRVASYSPIKNPPALLDRTAGRPPHRVQEAGQPLVSLRRRVHRAHGTCREDDAADCKSSNLSLSGVVCNAPAARRVLKKCRFRNKREGHEPLLVPQVLQNQSGFQPLRFRSCSYHPSPQAASAAGTHASLPAGQ